MLFFFLQESAQILKFGLFGLFASMVRSQPTPEKGKKPTIPEDFDDIIHGSGILTPNYGKRASLYGFWTEHGRSGYALGLDLDALPPKSYPWVFTPYGTH